MTEINGLPAHILLVHLIVVLVPLTAISLLLCAFWPAARRRLVWPTLVLAFAGMVATPVTTEAGEWLQRRVADTPLVRTHASLGDTLLPWTVGLFLLSAVIAALHVRNRRRERADALDAGAPAAAGAPGWPPTGGGGDEVMTVAAPVAVAPRRSRLDTVAAIAVPVFAVVLAVGSSVAVYRIGDSGAQAVWHNQFSSTPNTQPAGHQDGG